jgi:predicted naringenin-chalcone synthase
MTSSIFGIGLGVPEHFVTQQAAAQFALANCVATSSERRLAELIYEKSGIDSRRSVVLDSSTNGEAAEQSFFQPSNTRKPLGPSTAERMQTYTQCAVGLAEQAARNALQDASTAPEEITHIVTVSCSGFGAPGFDVALIKQLPLSHSVARTHVGFMGCHGAMNGLRVARSFVEADPTNKVLLVAVELCTLHYQYGWTPGRIVSNSLFADGAAAAVVSRTTGQSPWELCDDLSEIVPDCEDAMTWNIGNHGFEMTLSPAVPELILAGLRPRMDAWLERNGLRVNEIGAWAIHPGGPKILEACIEALDLPDDALAPSYEVLRRYGNMSSPTSLFVLEELRRTGATGPTVMLGFGPGLAIEGALLR